MPRTQSSTTIEQTEPMRDYLLSIIHQVPDYYQAKLWRLAGALSPGGPYGSMTIGEFRRQVKNTAVLLGPYNPFREVNRVGKKTWEVLAPILVADGILPQPRTYTRRRRSR